MRGRHGIALRLGIPVLLGSALIFVLIFATGYLNLRRAIISGVEQDARNLGASIVHQIAATLAPVEKMPLNLAALAADADLSAARIQKMMRRAMTGNPEVFGSAMAFEPYVLDPISHYHAPYFSRSGDGLQLISLAGSQYNYFQQDWYQIPKETGRAGWSEPYFDEGGGNALMITYSVPLYREINRDRRFIGVATADLTLDWLDRLLAELRVSATGYAFILSRNGTYITHPDKPRVINETIFSIAEARNDAGLRRLGREMIRGGTGFVPFTDDRAGRDGYLFFAPVRHSDWSIGIFFPKDDLLADLAGLNRQLLLLAAAGLALLALVVGLIARTITRPLTALTGAAREMATGNLEVTVPSLDSGGEIGILARSFDNMKESLQHHIRGLLETTAAKERMESELGIARDIQLGLLPKIFPPFPDIPEFGIHALLQSAREVGGDLYDFYRIDDDHVCFVLGDVSGKGVPASLFMAVTMTLVKMTAARGVSPDQILTEVNRQLSRDNASSMFVTLFCAVLHIPSGRLSYANGGHNPPVLLRQGSAPAFLDGTDGILLGAMEDYDYGMAQLQLGPGDGLLLYSDGVTEAMDEEERLFSEERLLEVLAGLPGRSPRETVETVMRQVMAFAGTAPQADDITLMMVRYRGA